MIRELTDEEIQRLPAAERERLRQQELLFEGNRLYDLYGKPLEQDHWGKYVAISRDGRTLLGDTSLDVLQRAAAAFGPGNFVFKVGEKAIGKIR